MSTSENLPMIYLVRHGQTAWSVSGQHTGLTDLPLTSDGKAAARLLGARLRKIPITRVFTSPLQRARSTCELACLPVEVTVDADLVEWDYGEYEGLRTSEILAARPGWKIFRDGCPGGEAPEDVLARALRVVERLRMVKQTAAVFSSGHFLRVLGACWLGFDARAGGLWVLDTASLSALGYEHAGDEPVMRFWNDTSHLAPISSIPN
jgi:probable phosphoglycerate mutase